MVPLTADVHRAAMVSQMLSTLPTPSPGLGIRANLIAADAALGWANGCGRAHPLGGYATWSLSTTSSLGQARLEFLLANGRHHRTDGPALVEYNKAGAVSSAKYYERELAHRSDGPAGFDFRRDPAGEPTYYHRALPNEEVYIADERGEHASAARHHELLLAGVDPQQVVAWMVVEAELDRERAQELIEADLDADLVVSTLKAGVREAGALIAVARGELPLSWAVAGT